MDDSFHELIVKARMTSNDRLKMAGLVLLGLVLLFLVILFGGYLGSLSVLALAGIGYGLFYLLRGFAREYEYTVTNGDLDIDLIIAQRKRRRVFSGAARTFDSMEPLDKQPAGTGEKTGTVIDCRSSHSRGVDYKIRTDYKGKPVIVLLSPDEKILNQLRKYNPGRIRLG
ncbi:MAG: hypothetical protein PHQ83_00960 [Eubacteriales bacterium]|nr:hypothetical protein [Eubacteriales bacterium]